MFKQFSRLLGILFIVVFYGFVGYSNAQRNDTKSLEASLNVPVSESADNVIQNYGLLRAQIAMSEYKKNVHESALGCNCGEEIDRYTIGLRQQWCAMFTSWVFREAGTPLTLTNGNDSWRIEQARDIATWLQANGTWYSKEDVLAQNLSPQVGDVMIFWRGNFEGDLGHADIVVGVDPAVPGYASLIGGNLNDQVTLRQSYFFEDHYGFLGFGRIEKPSQ